MWKCLFNVGKHKLWYQKECKKEISPYPFICFLASIFLAPSAKIKILNMILFFFFKVYFKFEHYNFFYFNFIGLKKKTINVFCSFILFIWLKIWGIFMFTTLLVLLFMFTTTKENVSFINKQKNHGKLPKYYIHNTTFHLYTNHFSLTFKERKRHL